MEATYGNKSVDFSASRISYSAELMPALQSVVKPSGFLFINRAKQSLVVHFNFVSRCHKFCYGLLNDQEGQQNVYPRERCPDPKRFKTVASSYFLPR